MEETEPRHEWNEFVWLSQRATELLERLAQQDKVPPVRPVLYRTDFDSNVPEELAALRDFLVRPLDSLTGEGDLAIDGLAIEGVTTSWKVVTTIRNHHRGLNPRITTMVATVSDAEETVYLDGIKLNE
ncbi:MAG TPA: hypothetical protein VLG28_02005 [Acidimicrobiia bacterium]|nr:hypothetical protein [Acidimicrobiia bacterium]